MPHVSSPLRHELLSNAGGPSSPIIKALLKATRRSTHKRHQTGCVIVTKAGSIAATGCSHSSSFRINELHSIHAEIHASWNSRHVKIDDSTAYILTIARKSGNPTYSAPCLTCAMALRTAGVKVVEYHNGDNHPMKHQWNSLVLDDVIESAGLKIYPRRKQ